MIAPNFRAAVDRLAAHYEIDISQMTIEEALAALEKKRDENSFALKDVLHFLAKKIQKAKGTL